jgi:ATP-dependent DNA ligase
MASPCALHGRGTVTEAMLYAFDLGDRKAKLARLLARKPIASAIVYNEHTDEDGAVVFRHACKLGLEGIVSKRLTAPYRSGPSRSWLKVKNPDSPAMIRAREHFARTGQ